MDGFIKDITSLYWWISVVLVGILINLFSSYSKPYTDKILSKYSSTRREKVKHKEEIRLKKIEKLKSSETEKMFLYMQISRNYLRCIVFLLFGIIFYSLPNVTFEFIYSFNEATNTNLLSYIDKVMRIINNILFYGLGSFLVLLAYYTWSKAIKLSDLLYEVLESY